MALTKEELIASLKNEVRILVHLASKVDADMLDYRPSPKQRSMIELLRYMTYMGPELIKGIKGGGFDVPSWTVASEKAANTDFAQTKAALAGQGAVYAESLGGFSEEDLAAPIEMFGQTSSKGSVIVNMVLCGHAAYRTQLFLYLKANGHTELNTLNLWGGVDG